jgi:hypothetical protein
MVWNVWKWKQKGGSLRRRGHAGRRQPTGMKVGASLAVLALGVSLLPGSPATTAAQAAAPATSQDVGASETEKPHSPDTRETRYKARSGKPDKLSGKPSAPATPTNPSSTSPPTQTAHPSAVVTAKAVTATAQPTAVTPATQTPQPTQATGGGQATYTPQPTVAVTATPTAAGTQVGTPTPVTPTPVTPTPSATTVAEPTPTGQATAAATATPTATGTQVAEATQTPQATQVATPTPTAAATATPLADVTVTPTVEATVLTTATPTVEATVLTTATPTATVEATATPTPTVEATATATATVLTTATVTPAATIPAQATIPAVSPPSGTQPTLLAAYEIRGPLPESRRLTYRPRQFTSGTVVDDVSLGDAAVGNPAAYAGWDLLATPNEGIMRQAQRSDWLVLSLNRPATVAVVWRAAGSVPGWLGGWARGPDVGLGGDSWPTYQRQFGAGEVALGGVFDSGASLGTHETRDTYWVLLGEADGRASAAPAVPAGQALPQPNQPCPSWVHDQYVASGPDGRTYATWHPQIDPVYWCYFGHEHGSNPNQFVPGYKPLFAYASNVAEEDEPHPGFKSYAFEDGQGHRWLITHHFGTGSLARACVRFHATNVAVASSSGEILADVHFMADFGKSVVNTTGQALTPPGCRDQASQAGGSNGERQLPAASAGAVGYEPWRLDAAATVLGLMGALTFNTTDPVVICNNTACDQAVPTGSSGTRRFFTYTRDFGFSAPAHAGTFYTDVYGRTLMSAGQAGAVRQYVRPGFSVRVPYHGDNQTCFTKEPWAAGYECSGNLDQGLSTMLEDSIRASN